MSTIHHYDPDTLLYLGVGEAITGPAGDLHLPAFATLNPPPDVPPGHVLRAVPDPDGDPTNCGWEVIEDWRGHPAYAIADGAAATIEVPGPLPAGVTLEARPSLCHVWQDGAWVYSAALAQAARCIEAMARIVEIEALQGRPLREIVLAQASGAPTPQAAVARLAELSAQIEAHRATLSQAQEVQP